VLQLPQPRGISCTQVLHVLRALGEVTCDAGSLRHRLSPALPPRRGIPLISGQILVYRATNDGGATDALASRTLIEARGLLLIKIDLRPVHDV
jgi:hypothetical protein